ncbi:hypothetical protein Bca4012_031071 [Brassica carinata]
MFPMIGHPGGPGGSALDLRWDLTAAARRMNDNRKQKIRNRAASIGYFQVRYVSS